MPAFVALLRGVNVGGARRVPMADWRALLAGLGYTRVATLLNSGNAVFHAAGGAGAAPRHARAIAAALATHLGAQVPVIVKTGGELAAIVAGNTLAADAARDPRFDPARLLVAFAPDAATLATLAPVAALVRPPERFLLGPHAAYLHCAGGLLQSRAAEALLGKAGRAATTRNWATTLKLQAMVDEAWL
jgi:uncharacterized protein (DUF1697 family)